MAKERKDGEGGLKNDLSMGREQTERKLALYPLLLIVALVVSPLERGRRETTTYFLLTLLRDSSLLYLLLAGFWKAHL